MEPKPPINAPPDSGKRGFGPKNNWEKKKGPIGEGSPSIKLGLGIGDGSGEPSHVIKQEKSEAFTPAQLHELHQQGLIFKYIVAGLPVPLHLIFPIWKSVDRSFGSANGGIYNQYPSFIGFGRQGFDYRSMMDPEPGRCRRTDGKKWRCSRDVVPDQKYCQRHMHRGRLRSRKHVEASEPCTPTTLKYHNTTPTFNSSDSTNTESNLSTSVPVNLQLATPSSNSSRNTPAAKAPILTSIVDISGSDNNVNAKKDSTPTTTSIGGINGSNNNVNAKKDSTATTTTTTYGSNIERNKNVYVSKGTTATGLMSAAADKNSNRRSNNDCVDGKDANYNHLNNRINIKRSISNGNNVNAGSLAASGFDFSPTSVLQVVGCSGSCLGYSNVVETELHRCRRTDGKKWRCSRDVIPYQKYCGLHLHRGAKKLASTSQSVTVAAAAPPNASVRLAPLAIPRKADNRINLDTNLSISIAASPRQTTNDEKSSTSSSSSSDATTVTDENGSMSHLLSLSP